MGSVKQGYLFVISGPSGAGKGAICAGLAQDENIMLSVSMTTRAPRAHEEEGRNYYFTDKERFRDVIAEGGFFEYAEVFGEYYGTPKAPALEHLEKGGDVILEIDVNGAMQIKSCMPDAVLVFIMPPSPEELRRRIEGRGTETPEHIARRLERAESEIAQVEEYDYCVVNDDLSKAIDDVRSIMQAEKLFGPNRQKPLTESGNADVVCRAISLRVDKDTKEIIERYKTGSIK